MRIKFLDLKEQTHKFFNLNLQFEIADTIIASNMNKEHISRKDSSGSLNPDALHASSAFICHSNCASKGENCRAHQRDQHWINISSLLCQLQQGPERESICFLYEGEAMKVRTCTKSGQNFAMERLLGLCSFHCVWTLRR